MQKIILGSGSPRRKEIMSYFSLPFTVVPPPFEENHEPTTHDPEGYVKNIAKQKALSLKDQYPDIPILTADTIVFAKGNLYVKPTSDEDAFRMLTELQGTWHQVFTGVSVLFNDQCYTEAEETKILMNKLTHEQMQKYHQEFFFHDKAGGYAIQKAGSIIVKKIEGCYYNIMGLPINTTRKLLAKIGVNLWDYLKRF